MIRIRTFLLPLLFFTLSLLGGLARAAEEPLPVDQAFRVSARAVDDHTVEVRFQIADGYYLYRHRFKFQAEGVTFGEASIPPGKPKKDDAFGQVEIYRHELVIPVPIVTGKPPFELEVSSQGCADMGICYPPQKQSFTIAAAGSDAGSGSFLARALGKADAPAASAAPAAAALADDEKRRKNKE